MSLMNFLMKPVTEVVSSSTLSAQSWHIFQSALVKQSCVIISDSVDHFSMERVTGTSCKQEAERWSHDLFFWMMDEGGPCMLACGKSLSPLVGKEACWWNLGITCLKDAEVKLSETRKAVSGCKFSCLSIAWYSLLSASVLYLLSWGGMFTTVTIIAENSLGS